VLARNPREREPIALIAPAAAAAKDHFPLESIYSRRETRRETRIEKKRDYLLAFTRQNNQRRSRSMQFSGRFVIASASGHFVYEQFARIPLPVFPIISPFSRDPSSPCSRIFYFSLLSGPSTRERARFGQRPRNKSSATDPMIHQ